jgi:hypothetical protein
MKPEEGKRIAHYQGHSNLNPEDPNHHPNALIQKKIQLENYCEVRAQVDGTAEQSGVMMFVR